MVDRFTGRAAFAIASVIFLAAVLLIARRAAPMFPVADEAVTELAALNALDGRQFLGPYSRYPWHHPGPALFYLLAPFYEVSGLRAPGLAAGALSINMFSLALAAWVLFRRGGPALALACIAALAVLVARVPGVLASPWNPHVAAVLTASVVIVSASVAGDWPAGLPVLVGLASIVVQTHIGTLPLAGVAIAVGSVALLASPYNGRRRVLGRAGVVLLVMWLIPFAEQIWGGGNISRLLQFAMAPSAGADWSSAVQAWADALLSVFRPAVSVPPGLLVPHDGLGWTAVAAVGEILLLAAMAFWARTSGRRVYMWLALELLTTSILSLWAVSQIPDGIHDHEVFWIAIVGAVNIGAILAWPLSLSGLDRWRALSSAAVILLVAGVAVGGSVQNRSPGRSFARALVQRSPDSKPRWSRGRGNRANKFAKDDDHDRSAGVAGRGRRRASAAESGTSACGRTGSDAHVFRNACSRWIGRSRGELLRRSVSRTNAGSRGQYRRLARRRHRRGCGQTASLTVYVPRATCVVLFRWSENSTTHEARAER